LHTLRSNIVLTERLRCVRLADDIYREDIVFRDPRNTFAGLERYKSIFKTVRVFGRIFFRPQKIEVEILRIWQVRVSPRPPRCHRQRGLRVFGGGSGVLLHTHPA
jgi:hypothetical protein